jgi:hypothetical protein
LGSSGENIWASAGPTRTGPRARAAQFVSRGHRRHHQGGLAHLHARAASTSSLSVRSRRRRPPPPPPSLAACFHGAGWRSIETNRYALPALLGSILQTKSYAKSQIFRYSNVQSFLLVLGRYYCGAKSINPVVRFDFVPFCTVILQRKIELGRVEPLVT